MKGCTSLSTTPSPSSSSWKLGNGDGRTYVFDCSPSLQPLTVSAPSLSAPHRHALADDGSPAGARKLLVP